MPSNTRSLPLAVPLLVALLVPAALSAQFPPNIGLSTAGGQWFENYTPHFEAADKRDRFGEALAVGDFNGDGADDLATGVPHDDGPSSDTGAVVVRYGVRGGGLKAGPPQLLVQTQPNAMFGFSLAAGDFNGDGFDELAVGVPDKNGRGAVYVYYGLANGLQFDGLEILDESVSPEPEHICDGAQFGSSLAAGNFDGDPYDDLAIGASGACERVGGSLVNDAGAVFVAHGQEFGLMPFYGYRISQNSYAIEGEVEEFDSFGWAVATGDFNRDGDDDLAIGVPGENSAQGAVQVIMGSQWGLLYANNVLWLPGALGEVPETDDFLGRSLASGDFDGDGFDDLAIGTPREDLGPNGVYEQTGSIDIAYGAADPVWFDLSRTDHLAQSTIFHDEAHEGVDDFFGWAFAAGDFDADGRDDLAIGAWGDDWSGTDHGAVTVLTGTPLGLGASSRFYLIGVGWDGVPGHKTQPDQYSGWSVVAGDFDGNGYADLAIGVPGFDHEIGSLVPDVGGEAVIYGLPFGALLSDGFEIGSTGRWSTSTS